MDKYQKHLLLKEIGHKGQEKITLAKILIIGLGGLGNPIIRYLASSGIGSLGLVDDDLIEISNLARQNNYLESDIDKSKVEISEKIAKEINPKIKIDSYFKRLDKHLLEKIGEGYDLVIDASDNFKTKFLLNEFCQKNNKILVSASFTGFKGYLSVYKTGVDRPCFACLHPKEISLEKDKACFSQGAFSPALGVIGSFMACEIIKEVANINSLAGNLMVFDFINNKHRLVKLEKNKNCLICS
jgi:molybdopterin/thiamine biosynthesis adenylyltransferase